MSSNDDFDEIFGDMGIFNSKFMKKFQSQMDEIFEAIKNGDIKGKWETKEINEPGAKGYIIRGHFWTDKSWEPIEPLKPSKRRPVPERPFDIPEKALDEAREPLTDIFEEENSVKVYVELPGEEESDIKLKVTDENAEIKGKNFYKMIDLPHGNLDTKNVASEYKNGVLKITIPKKPQLRDEDARKTKMV